VIDQIVPHLLRLDGDVVLHASAVVVDGQALAFLGPSGIGKSSLAGGFVAAGTDLLADDFVPLREQDGRYLTTVAYPGLRLWPDAAEHLAGRADDLAPVTDYQAKRRWPVPNPNAGADVPLAALVALGLPPEDPAAPDCEVGLVQGTDAFTLVYGQVVRVVRGDRARQAAELDWVARLVEAVPVVLVEHRRAYDLLPAVVAEIRAALGRLAETGWGLRARRS
jgi:hypothetical protein